MNKLKIKSVAFDNLILTADKIGSSLILKNDGKTNEDIRDVQTVMVKGPFTKAESGLDVEVGDKVVIGAGARLLRIFFDKVTGEYVDYNPSKPTPNPADVDEYLLVSNRVISMVLDK